MNRNSHIWSRFFILLGIVFLFHGCYQEQIIIDVDPDQLGKNVLKIDNSYGFVDSTDNMILYSIASDTISSFSPKIKFIDYTSISFDGKVLAHDEVNELGEVMINHPFQIIAKRENDIDTFQLIFTNLPLLHIQTSNEIQDEPKTLSNISLQYNNQIPGTHTFYSYAGIEIRGASSTRYSKKSYGLELWENEYGDDYSTSLLGMHYGEDWILDAMYIDDLRVRNKLSFELWEKLSSVPISDQKPGVVPGIHCEYVELFINNRYFGLYTLDEKLDEKLLHYAPNQYDLGGVLYKAIYWSDGSTKFNSYNSNPPEDLFWDGWELIYPQLSAAWNPLDDLRQLIVKSDDEVFKEEIASLFDLDNAINYYLFVNLLKAADNSGKNTYLARYTDQSAFFYIPWDIEASWGLFWNRDKSSSSGIVSNHLFARLIETNAGNYNDRLKEQWFEYRKDILSEETLLQNVDQYYNLLNNNGAIERENLRWGEFIINLDEEHEFISAWISERLEYLDDYFD